MRDLKTLINTILLFIPEKEFEDTVRKLTSVSSSVDFAAPEMKGYWFNMTREVLNELPLVSKESPVWLKVVYCIFTSTKYPV